MTEMIFSVGSFLLSAWNAVWPIAVAILLFGLVVVVHEFGHFFFAKLFKVRVNEFSVGFGPAIFKKKKGETQYSVRAIPFGGYCSMEGEDEDSADENAFGNKSVIKRIMIVAAGAFNNLVLGLLFVGIMLGIQGRFYTTTVRGFYEGASSYQSGLRTGDKILSVDGRRVYCSSDLSYMLMSSEDDTLEMTVEREGQTLSLDSVKFDTRELEGKSYISLDFAVTSDKMSITRPFTFVADAFKETVSVGRVVWISLADLVGGKYGLNEISGPVGVVSAVGETVSNAASSSKPLMALDSIFYLLAIITINLGIMNLLPLPALDGGRLVFLIIEAIRRKPVPAKYEGFVHAAGFAVLMIFIVFITGHDILKLFRGG